MSDSGKEFVTPDENWTGEMGLGVQADEWVPNCKSLVL